METAIQKLFSRLPLLASGVLLVLYVGLGSSSVYGENEIQTVPGGATIQTLMSNLESVSTRQNIMGMLESADSGDSNVGVNYTYSDHVRIYRIPLSVTLDDGFSFGSTVPYVYKRKTGYFEDDEIEREGLGDISLYITHVGLRPRLRISTTFTIKIPTGFYKRFESKRETVPLGTGSYDYIVGGALIFKPEISEEIRFTMSSGYRINGKSTHEVEADLGGVVATYQFKEQKGNVLNLSFGFVYFSSFENLLFYGDLAYTNIERSKISYSDPLNIVSINTTNSDSLSTIDLTLGFKYAFSDSSAFRLGVTLPTWTAYDSDVDEKQERQMVADIGFDVLF